MEINTVSKEELLRIPGIGARGVMKILNARRFKRLTFDDLKKLKISLKKAKYFITCNKDFQRQVPFYRESLKLALIKPEPKKLIQPSLFDFSAISGEL
jgi:predicted DNA-binding helix-hairpin-helix protein